MRASELTLYPPSHRQAYPWCGRVWLGDCYYSPMGQTIAEVAIKANRRAKRAGLLLVPDFTQRAEPWFSEAVATLGGLRVLGAIE